MKHSFGMTKKQQTEAIKRLQILKLDTSLFQKNGFVKQRETYSFCCKSLLAFYTDLLTNPHRFWETHKTRPVSRVPEQFITISTIFPSLRIYWQYFYIPVEMFYERMPYFDTNTAMRQYRFSSVTIPLHFHNMDT